MAGKWRAGEEEEFEWGVKARWTENRAGAAN